MDEPTAALGVVQRGRVLDTMRRVRDRGVAVVLISHNMPEVLAVADRIEVLRLGRRVARFQAAQTSVEDLVGAMTGAIVERGRTAAGGQRDDRTAARTARRRPAMTAEQPTAPGTAGQPVSGPPATDQPARDEAVTGQAGPASRRRRPPPEQPRSLGQRAWHRLSVANETWTLLALVILMVFFTVREPGKFFTLD